MNGATSRPALHPSPPQTPVPGDGEMTSKPLSQPSEPKVPLTPSSKPLPGAAYPPYIMPSTLPQPPFIDVGGVANFRSLGGYLVKSGTHIIRPNIFYRCAHPMQITLDGIEHLTRTLGVQAIYDLRSGPEVSRTTAAITSAAVTAHASNPSTSPSALPPPLPSVSPRFASIHHFTPVFAREDTGPDALARKLSWYSAPSATELAQSLPYDYSEGFVNAYRHIAIYGVDAYTILFRHILDRPTEPFVFHCTAGKDRTGVFAALVLRLAGVDDDTIAWEYSLTEPGLGPWRTTFINRMSGGSAKAVMRGGDDDDNSNHSEAEKASQGDSMTRDEAARVVGSRAGNMRAFLTLVLDAEFGGVERYMMEKCGFTLDEVRRIRDNVVVGLDTVGEEAVVKPCGIEGWTPDGGVVD